MPGNGEDQSDSVKCHASTKPKQTKSRNGCATCKLKRLKCDEKKPSCDQCAKRNVSCGGYKKDFKWRPFDDQNGSIVAKQPPSSKSFASTTVLSSSISKVETVRGSQRPYKPAVKSNPRRSHTFPSDRLPDRSSTSYNQQLPPPPPPPRDPLLSYPADAVFPYALPSSLFSPPDFAFNNSPDTSTTGSSETDQSQTLDLRSSRTITSYSSKSATSNDQIFKEHRRGPGPTGLQIVGCGTISQELEPLPIIENDTQQSLWAESSAFQDALMPMMLGSYAKQPYSVFENSLQVRHSVPLYNDQNDGNVLEDGDVEEVVRRVDDLGDNRRTLYSDRDMLPFSNPNLWLRNNSLEVMYKQPMLSQDSDEMIMTRFDKRTCGIMSVKDGPDENPWRTYVMPLMHKSSLIYHTAASMACLQQSARLPQFLNPGKQHFEKAFSSLSALASNNIVMEYDVAFAAMLGLAFSEAWGCPTVTGTDYIKQSKLLMYRAIDECQRSPRDIDHLERVKFLCRTWIYIDVIARLTSFDEDESNDFEQISNIVSGPLEARVDPLMGVAATLFPIVGKVANLIKQVCRLPCNTAALITEASNLKALLEAWQPMAVPDLIKDETSTVEHNVQTAKAYKWATLLYLHQAVPEIPMESSAVLAGRAMQCLAMVPLSSRTVIVQIYPLMAAGCEARTVGAQKWVRERWDAMKLRMTIGNVDRCLDVVEEVWHRRNQAASPSSLETDDAPSHDSSSASISFDHSGQILSGFPRWIQPLDGRDPVLSLLGSLQALHPLPPEHQGGPSDWTDTDALTGELKYDFTVRGRLHWVGVMKDFGWEVLLG